MEAKDVKVGMRVVPHDKTSGTHNWIRFNDDNSMTVKHLRDNGFLYCGKCDGDRFVLSSSPKCIDDTYWYFHASDFEPAVIEVGDVVRQHAGNEAVVREVHPSGTFFKLSDSAVSWWHESDLDLVRKAKRPLSSAEAYPDATRIEFPAIKPQEPADRRPTVGDWVEVVDAKDPSFGKVGRVSRILENLPYPVYVRLGCGKEIAEGFNDLKLTTPPEQKPETVLKSDADAAVRRAYSDGVDAGIKRATVAASTAKVSGLDKPTDEQMAKYFGADS